MNTMITMPRADDYHTHLRQDDMLELVTPLTAAGGVGRCIVMPNTVPPITTVDALKNYRALLSASTPDIDYLMTLYLCPALNRDLLVAAKSQGLIGVKCYPQGVTTNAQWGVAELHRYDELFAVMEKEEIALLLHGEAPSSAIDDICILNAESRFLPELERIHIKFPQLRIVLEHVTTREAVEFVQSLGETVAATITAHHLCLTVDDWAGKNHNFCKPVAKYPHDRDALRAVVASGDPKFFLGSDSAPHPRSAKESACGCAGVFTAPLLLPYLADTFESMGCLERLVPFCCQFGHQFYGLDAPTGMIQLERKECIVPAEYGGVVPFRAGEMLRWQIVSPHQ